jgi:hypothetical protein
MEKREININGCIDVQGGLNIHAGASGKFFDLFDKSTKVTLFEKTFQLFNVGILHSCCRVLPSISPKIMFFVEMLWNQYTQGST